MELQNRDSHRNRTGSVASSQTFQFFSFKRRVQVPFCSSLVVAGHITKPDPPPSTINLVKSKPTFPVELSAVLTGSGFLKSGITCGCRFESSPRPPGNGSDSRRPLKCAVRLPCVTGSTGGSRAPDTRPARPDGGPGVSSSSPVSQFRAGPAVRRKCAQTNGGPRTCAVRQQDMNLMDFLTQVDAGEAEVEAGRPPADKHHNYIKGGFTLRGCLRAHPKSFPSLASFPWVLVPTSEKT